MPRIYMNEEGEQVAQSSNNNAPIEPPQDHTVEHNSTDVVVQGSKGSIIKTHRYTFIFSQALQDRRVANEERLRLAEEKRIADEKQAKEDARLDKNAKARMRRYLNKTFDVRVEEYADARFKKTSIKILRGMAKQVDIDTKTKTSKAQLKIAIASVHLKEIDERTYQSTSRYTNFDDYKVAKKGDAQ